MPNLLALPLHAARKKSKKRYTARTASQNAGMGKLAILPAGGKLNNEEEQQRRVARDHRGRSSASYGPAAKSNA